MKKTTTLFLFLMMGLFSLAQDKINLVIFSEDGYTFYAYINGVKQNNKPESNVKVTGLSPNVSLRIEFEDKAKPQLKQNMAMEPGFEHTVRIKEDSKKQLKLRYFGQTALNDPGNAGAATVAYHSTETTGDNGTAVNQTTSSGGSVSQTTVTTTTTQVNTNTNVDPNNVAVNVNMAGVGISMNVSGMENMSGGTLNSTSSTTVTTTSSSSSNTNSKSEAASTNAPVAKSTGCSTAMGSADFSKLKQSVEAKPFSDTKMSTAKVATKNACLSVNQIKEICSLFSMDEDKLAYAKYAYDYCTEKGNYYQVGDVFSFSSSTDELNAFLEK
ncbi:MAG: DUF4476 domain-containing protein [Bacteroidia bacterium]|nr:DUF4476 domain-containing protein [Bacteroidia bacterium]